jgi:hypothetical protein
VSVLGTAPTLRLYIFAYYFMVLLVSWGEDERGAEVGCINRYGVLHVLGGVCPTRCVCHVCCVCCVACAVCIGVCCVFCVRGVWSIRTMTPFHQGGRGGGAGGPRRRHPLANLRLQVRAGRGARGAARRVGGWAPRAPAARAM